MVVGDGYPASADMLKSEIRGIFVWLPWTQEPDWNVMAQGCIDNGLNMVVLEVYLNYLWNFGTHTLLDFPDLRTAATAFHAKGLHVYVLLTIGITDGGSDYNVIAGAGMAENPWLCFTKARSVTMLTALANSLSLDYTVDGVIYDYIRYNSATMCFCPECLAKFKLDTGHADTVFPDDVLDGERYFLDFLQWRLAPVTDAVQVMSTAIRTNKPAMKVACSCFVPYAENIEHVWVYWIGQHTADWVDKGFLDFVAPMIYTDVPADMDLVSKEAVKLYGGAKEGKLPMPVFISNGINEVYSEADFAACTQLVRDNVGDGWILWGYNGPGLDIHGVTPEYPAYITALDVAGLMETVFAIENLAVTIVGDHATVEFDTVNGAGATNTTAKIEYANAELFWGDLQSNWSGISYINMEYTAGTIESSAVHDHHSFSIPITAFTQFRVQATQGELTVSTKQTSITDYGVVLPVYHTLTVPVSSKGAVTVDPDAASYLSGTPVELTAAVGAGYYFMGWTINGAAAGSSNPLMVPMDNDYTITALFQGTNQALLLDEDSYELVFPPLVTVAGKGYTFRCWEDGSTSPTRTIVLDADQTVIAYYMLNSSLLDEIIGNLEKASSENFWVTGFWIPGFWDECRLLNQVLQEFET